MCPDALDRTGLSDEKSRRGAFWLSTIHASCDAATTRKGYSGCINVDFWQDSLRTSHLQRLDGVVGKLAKVSVVVLDGGCRAEGGCLCPNSSAQ